MHKTIKAVHHLRNVSQEQPPITIRKMTQTLTTIIKPAVPTEKTLDLILGNAKWAVTMVIILTDHFKDLIDALVMELLSLPHTEWKDPFRIAANWARHNLRRRLLPESVREAKNAIMASFADRDRWRDDSEAVAAVLHRETHTVAPPQMKRPATPPPSSTLRRRVTVTAQVLQPLTYSPADITSPPPHLPA